MCGNQDGSLRARWCSLNPNGNETFIEGDGFQNLPPSLTSGLVFQKSDRSQFWT